MGQMSDLSALLNYQTQNIQLRFKNTRGFCHRLFPASILSTRIC